MDYKTKSKYLFLANYYLYSDMDDRILDDSLTDDDIAALKLLQDDYNSIVDSASMKASGKDSNSFEKEDNYNHDHDPGNGRFSTGGGGSSGSGSEKTDSEKYKEFQDKNFPNKPVSHFKGIIKDNLSGKPSDDPKAVAEILSYQGNSQHLNRYLAEHPDGKFVEGMTKDLDKSFTWTTKKEFTTLRGLSDDHYNISKKGQEFTELNYGSTSVNPKESISSVFGDGPILRIKVPKGQKVAVPDLYSGTVDEISIFSQQEILIPRKTTYKVTKITKTPLTGRKLVDVEIVKGE